MKNTTEIMVAAAKHKGASVVEVLQNCIIFNNGIHDKIADRAWKAEKTVMLRHGEKMLFGKENDRGIVLDGWNLKAVTLGEEGYTIDDVSVHDATTPKYTAHQAQSDGFDNDLPVCAGVIRSVDSPSYDSDYEEQIAEVQGKTGKQSFTDFLMSSAHIWEIK
jgi:2-oxoglutarate ferredoxin oxidoreductase subunit beta